MKVLYIDDNKEITELLKKVLTSQGHEVVLSNSGREGLNLIQKGDTDVILLDVAMPEFSGEDIINELVKDGTIKNHNIVLFTASSVTDAKIGELVKKGVKGHVEKPVSIDELFSVLKKFE